MEGSRKHLLKTTLCEGGWDHLDKAYVYRLGDTAPLNLVYLAQGRRLPSTRRGDHAFPSIPPCTKCTGAGKHARQSYPTLKHCCQCGFTVDES